MKILIVDDSKTMRRIIMRSLAKAGFADAEIAEAENGRDGCAVVSEFQPEVILCDWNMPDMPGIEFLSQIREAGNKSVFGFITSECGDSVRQAATERGADFFITKPFTVEDLQGAIKGVLA